MATRKHTPPTEAYPLSLVSYPPERKAAVIEALQRATKGSNELTLEGATALVEGAVPTIVDYYDTPSVLDEARRALEEAGATVTVASLHPSSTIRGLIDELGDAISAHESASKDPALGHLFDRLTDAIWQAPAETQSVPNAFEELDEIQDELLDLVNHFQLLDQRLYGQLDGVPEEFVPAATVLHNATEALDQLHNRLDRCNVRMADLRRGPGWRERHRAEMQVSEEGAA